MNLEIISTTYKNGIKAQEMLTTEFKAVDEVENQVLNLYPQFRYQTFQGFGGALTESAAYIYSLMNREQKDQVIQQYFHQDNMNYQMIRIPIDSCDFSLEHYEASSEENQKNFTLERMGKYIFPMFEDIKKAAGEQLQVMVSPWSPPAFMKTNGQRNGGGKLKKEYYKDWAEYICRYIIELQKLGINVTALSIQNEPKAVQTWDSCIYTAEEEKEFLRDYLYPALMEHQLDMKIYIWDHNKERALDRAMALIDEKTDSMITGIAVHWYSGDHFEALQMIGERYPNKEIILSEACIEYSKYDQGDCLENARKYAHDMIGNMKNGLTGFYDWNLILDERGGPNHVGNFCDSPYLYHTKTGELEERSIQAYLWHFCKYITPGAVRIGSSAYTDKLEAVAFDNGKEYSVVMLNRTEEKLDVYIRLEGKTAFVSLEPESIVSGKIMY
jgi:glucosylceramidase